MYIDYIQITLANLTFYAFSQLHKVFEVFVEFVG